MPDAREEIGRKSSEGGRGASDQASPAAVERYLKGVDFPCDKDDLIEQARGNGAPSDVIHVMEGFSEKEYGSPVDVAKEVSRVQ